MEGAGNKMEGITSCMKANVVYSEHERLWCVWFEIDRGELQVI